MHAIKVSWVGQTYALAKCSDSGGKKSRIRRSKEERKAMAESFIKKYQDSNNGNFPSLNLAHKEVGGSFYTVREIVREIIQENRVLGPAKFTSEESEQYPLGSISTEPLVSLPSKDDCQSIGEELLTVNGQLTGHQHQSFDSSSHINGKLVDEECKELDAMKSAEREVLKKQMDDEPIYMKLHHDQKLDEVKNVVGASTAKVSSITADIIVETFPIRSAAKPIYCVDGKSEDTRDLTGTPEEQETKTVEVASVTRGSVLDGMDSPENNFSDSMDEKVSSNFGNHLVESRSCSAAGNGIASNILEVSDLQVDVSHKDISTLQTSDQSQLVAGAEPQGRQEAVLVQTKADIQHSGSTKEGSNSTLNRINQPLSQEAVLVEKKVDIQHCGSTKEGSKSTLNRINLESWEETSKKSALTQTNPILGVFKALITAFLKFWSE